MTSEICIANRRALVLAADSAVTVTRWEGGKKEERYFKGANKIFQLSMYQPVGLMIFDTADLHRVPWEIIVKEFREEFGRKKCGNLQAYADAFFDFVATNRKIFNDKFRQDIFVEMVDQGIMRNINYLKEVDTVKAAGADTVASSKAREDAFDDLDAASLLWGAAVGINPDKIRITTEKYIDTLRHEASVDVRIFDENAPYDIDKLIHLGARTVFKFPEIFMSCTGLVVAGYGDDEYFPSYLTFDCHGLVDDELIFAKTDEFAIQAKSAGHINAFATKAMVDTFTMGFGPDVLQSVTNSLADTLNKFAEDVCKSAGVPIPDISLLLSAAIKNHQENWTQSVMTMHSHPLNRVIGSLPIDEMTNLAETLVMLESLKEKVTQPSESVGGPIDVAIITKGEGFLWAKRKHFFDPVLNPRFAFRQQEGYVRRTDEVT